MVFVQGFLLFVVIFPDEILQCSLKNAAVNLLAVTNQNRGAIAVGSGYKDDVLLPKAVAEKAREHIRLHNTAADMPKMKLLAAIGHPGCDNRPFRQLRALLIIFYVIHYSPSFPLVSILDILP
jgi:hypothetical protein